MLEQPGEKPGCFSFQEQALDVEKPAQGSTGVQQSCSGLAASPHCLSPGLFSTSKWVLIASHQDLHPDWLSREQHGMWGLERMLRPSP